MNSKFSFWPHICSLLLSLTFSMGCDGSSDPNTAIPIVRPENVPQEAIWSGGPDGGVFVYVKKDEKSPAHIYEAEIYHESTGEIWYKGRLTMIPSDSPSFDYNAETSFSGWDGDTLYLRDGRKLKAIDPTE